MRGDFESASAPRAVDTIVFDLDGTLIDSREDIAIAVNHTLEHFGYGKLDYETIYRFIGHGATQLLQGSLKSAVRIDRRTCIDNSRPGWPHDATSAAVRIDRRTCIDSPRLERPHDAASAIGVDLMKVDASILENGRAVYIQFYSEHLLDHTRLYDGVEDTLIHFRNKRLAVLSNKPEMLSKIILKGLGAAEYFCQIFGGESLPHKKPDPKALLEAIERIGADPASTAFVGDSTIDLETGSGAGVFTCGVTYGLGRPEDIRAARPDVLLEKMGDLACYLA